MHDIIMLLLVLLICALGPAAMASRRYRIRIDDIMMKSSNSEYINSTDGSVESYNDTHEMFNAGFCIAKKSPPSVVLTFTLMKQQPNNEWTAIYTFDPRDPCEFTHVRTSAFLKDMLEASNFPRSEAECPFKPGCYWIKNFIVKEESYPPILLPFARMRMVMTLQDDMAEIMSGYVTVHIE